ncbi:putative nuclease HARBI1 [Pleurodeles waltl]|uniref:putative nuclease HARBI1 n=1 Tax=Pleurodeles waltl TaxID=8319 RepID=UPI0037095B90
MSDHSPVMLELAVLGGPSRAFMWRLPHGALRDQVFRDEIRDAIVHYFAENQRSVTSAGTIWEAFKVVIRGICLSKQHSVLKVLRYDVRLRMRNAPVYRPLVDLATLGECHVIQTYCLNRETIMELVGQLEPDLLPDIRHPNAIPPTVQVLSVLHYLASGSFQVTVSLAAGMSQSMFSNVLRDVLSSLLKHLGSYIWFPQRAKLTTVKAAFYGVAHIPLVIEGNDGTHIGLMPLRWSEQIYRNRKNINSVNVQLVCLADQYISQVTAKFPGSVHDSFILQNSNIPHMMAPLMRDRAWIIGESGYPNLPWLLTPVRHSTADGEDCYNEAHGHTRWVIERCFGLLNARFHCLHISGGTLLYNPQKVCQIIVACCMLHNLGLSCHIPLLDAEEGVAVPVADEGDMGSDEEEDDEDAADSRAELIQQ